MDVSDLKELAAEVKKRMDTQLDHVRREFSGVRTGRASVTILDTVHWRLAVSHADQPVASLSIQSRRVVADTSTHADGGDRKGHQQPASV